MSKTTQEWRRKRLSDASDKAGGKAALGALMGLSSGAFIRQMIDGERPITEKTIDKIESLRGFRGWFASESDIPTTSSGSLDLPLSHHMRETVPTVTWGDLKNMSAMPETFELQARDGALGVHAPKGTILRLRRWDGGDLPYGEAVLFRDSRGDEGLRICRQRPGGAWVAFAPNRDYADFDSAVDGLSILAVMIGITRETPWSELALASA